MENVLIRKIIADEVAEAMALEVFMEFETPVYSPAGLETCKKDRVANPEYLENVRQGQAPIYAAFDGEKMAGLKG